MFYKKLKIGHVTDTIIRKEMSGKIQQDEKKKRPEVQIYLHVRHYLQLAQSLCMQGTQQAISQKAKKAHTACFPVNVISSKVKWEGY